ncbi:MAG: type IV pili methyl-accepting chemotaxis transducer N-terminal domain-containing protein [Candidatus Competibacteraceae bacterium]|nr:type IV pili methyl-accepting chemotaxis transducer N-terminal domain-containing protein [Candidatus Competibacteraceae bacterium]
MRDSRDYSALRGFSVTYLTLLGTLVLFIVLMGVIFVVLARQNQQNEVYFKNASEQRLLSRAIVTEALEAARGKETAFTKIKDSRDRFEQALNDEKNGNASLGLPPSPEAIQPYLAALESR